MKIHSTGINWAWTKISPPIIFWRRFNLWPPFLPILTYIVTYCFPHITGEIIILPWQTDHICKWNVSVLINVIRDRERLQVKGILPFIKTHKIWNLYAQKLRNINTFPYILARQKATTTEVLQPDIWLVTWPIFLPSGCYFEKIRVFFNNLKKSQWIRMMLGCMESLTRGTYLSSLLNSREVWRLRSYGR